jgi:hypothetical protein
MSKRLLLVVLFSIFVPASALACSCATPGPVPCSGLGAKDVVFVGTVLHIDNPVPEDGRTGGPGESRYRFRVDEKLAGTQESEIDVYSGRGRGDCSYHFQLGRQYLVSPYKQTDGRLFAYMCSITRPMELAQALLPELRAMRDHQRVASLYGVLRSAEEPDASVTDDQLGKPLTNTEIEIRSEDHVFDTKTDSNGAYAFYGVTKGEYRIAAELPKNLELAQMILSDPLPPISLPENACYEYDVAAYPTGNIKGRVLGPDGKPLHFAAVELFRPENYPPRNSGLGWMESQEVGKGYFEFTHVGPGDYIIVYNNSDDVSTDTPFGRAFYPGVTDVAKAGRIHVEAGGQVTNADIHVAGGKPTRSITVRLVAEMGKLPDIHYVETHAEDGTLLTEEEPSPGVYAISLFKDTRYKMHGEGYCSATGKESQTDPIEVDGSDEMITEITLIFRGPGCGE